MPHFNFCFLFITTVIKQELILHFIAQGKKFINKVKKKLMQSTQILNARLSDVKVFFS